MNNPDPSKFNWSRRNFLAATALSGVSLPSLLLRAGEKSQRRPNVVLILADDLGYGDLGCHGHPMLQTPNLDRLHQQSTRLTNFHVSPTCSPSRAALLTGRHEFRCGVTNTNQGRHFLRADLPTLADVLRAAGYDTALFGKWHLGDNSPLLPTERGFQSSLMHGGGAITATPDRWGNSYFNPWLNRNGRWQQHEGYCTDVFFENAAEWIRSRAGAPFFCFLPVNAPHRPNQVAEKYARPYLDRGVDAETARYFGMIANLDENVGRLAAQLDHLGLAEDTIVIFMSDNGAIQGGSIYNAGLKGTKSTPDQGGTRSACFIRWPRRFPDTRGISALTAHLDLLPTLAELCDAECPSGLDGRSLAPLLDGKLKNWPDQRTLYIHVGRWPVTARAQDYRYRGCAIRVGNLLLVNNEELYDLESDPGQTKNAAANYAPLLARLRGKYDRWWDRIAPDLEFVQPIWLGAERGPTRLTCHDWRQSIEFPCVPLLPLAEQDRLEALTTSSPGRSTTGAWPVEIRHAASYRFTLSLRPQEAPALGRKLKTGRAEIACAGQRAQAEITEGDEYASLRLTLPAGRSWLEGWFTGQTAGFPTGAYFITVEREA